MAIITGDNGNNLEIGTSAADEIYGLGAVDLLRGAGGNDTIEGGNGPDSLYGDQGDDEISGGAGDDIIRGGRGDDTLDGGDGSDLVRGDLGDDWIMSSPGDDLIDGGDGIDILDYSNSPSGVDVDLSLSSGLLFAEGGHAEGDAIVNVEVIGGSLHDDRIDVADIFDAEPHGVYGNEGDDELWGFRFDILDGGPGDDRLVTHNGGTVEGGPGADTFRFFGDIDEPTTINDFNSSEDDVIELSSVGFSGVTPSDVRRMLDGSSGSVLNLDLLGVAGRDHETITLEGVDVSDLSVGDFILG